MRHYKTIKFLLIFLLALTGLSTADEITSTMKNYCVIPPFMEVDTKPTIILIQDFSGSMQFQAYYPFYYGFPDFVNNKVYIFNGYQLADVTYDKNRSYYGYFKPNEYYKYDSAKGYWVVNSSCKSNVKGNDVNVGNSKNCISGNILNFVATSRIDVALKSLTGGKTGKCGNNELCLVNRGAFRYVHDTTTDCNFKIEPHKYWDDEDQYNKRDYDMQISITEGNDKNKDCKIDGISKAWLRIKIDPAEKVGILQKNADLGDFALMVFASNHRYGEIRTGVKEYRDNGMSYLVEKLDNELPWYGTPTGEALREAYDYLRQNDYYSYESNSNYISRGSEKDPFYDDSLGRIIPCKKPVIILISDGEWNGSVDPDGVAKTLHTTDLRSDLRGKQRALVFTLFTFANSEYGKNAMRSIAAAGSFTDLDNDNNPFDIDTTQNSFLISYPRPHCNPSGSYDDKCKEWDNDRDGEPDGYFYASSGKDLENAMKTIFTAIKKYSYSGGAVAVLGKKDKESSATGIVLKGSVLTQSLFFSQKYGIEWVGKVYGYWYDLIDGTMREDTDSNKILNYTKDKIIEFELENGKTLVINRYNVKSTDGSKDTLDTKLYDTDNINYLFETGYNLWSNFDESNSDTDDDRKIYYAACEKGNSCLKEFKYNSLSDFMLDKSYGSNVFRIPLLGFPGQCFNMCHYFDNMSSFDFIGVWNKFLQCLNNNNDYDKLIKYIRGKDYAGWRNRTTGGKVWKLGDIIHSSPKIVHYRDKNVIIIGANDGMLHVFKLGKSTEVGLSGANLVKLKGDNIGDELWAFIPLNMLPYLRFLADPNYCHTYYVDSAVYVFDTKDGRKILIGSMRLGGGTGENTNTANKRFKPVNPPKWACPTTLWDFMKQQCENCSNTFSFFKFACNMIPSTPPDFSHCIGLSSYFAIDITDIDKPKFLWEFSHPDLGFTYSGPAVIEKKDGNNVKTYLLFGSGPTNYYGNSNQHLKLFVVNLDGSNVNSPYIIDTGVRNAFSGRLFTKGFDVNKDGDTDYVFLGYSRRTGNIRNWKGGLLMVDVRQKTPSSWTVSRYLENSMKPITSKIEIGSCFGRYYLYFGTGRWFFKSDNSYAKQKNRLYGIPLRCNINTAKCTPIVSISDNSTNICRDAQRNIIKGWYVELDLGDTDYYKERVITDPLITKQNVVLYTTIEPTTDPCEFGGRTRIWALNCATGGSLVDSCPVYNIDLTKLKGSALLQLSGGNIQQINLQQIVNQQQTNKTKHTGWYKGTAPEGAPSFVTPLPPSTGEILLWLER